MTMALVRDLICSTLREVGYKVTEAYDGPSALDALDRHPLQLAVLDILMPGMSGIDVCERARENGWNGSVMGIGGKLFAAPWDIPSGGAPKRGA